MASAKRPEQIISVGLVQVQFQLGEEYRGLPELWASSAALSKNSKYTKWVI